MEKQAKKPEEKKNILLDNYKKIRLEIFGKTAIYTLIIVLIAGVIGYVLDQTFGTYPKLLIGGVIASYPINMILMRKKFKKIATDKLKTLKNGSN